MNNLFNYLLSCLCVADTVFLISNALVLPFHFDIEVCVKNIKKEQCRKTKHVRLIFVFIKGLLFRNITSPHLALLDKKKVQWRVADA